MENGIETGLVTVKEAAELLGLSARRVRQFIEEGRLPGQKIGRQWLLKRSDVIVFATKPRTVGRPEKPVPTTASNVELPERSA